MSHHHRLGRFLLDLTKQLLGSLSGIGIILSDDPHCAYAVQETEVSLSIHTPQHITMGWRDEWPSMSDGNQYDGKQLLDLVRNGNSPFHEVWAVRLLILEIEENLNAQVTDIPIVNKGSNNYVSSCLYIPSQMTQDRV
jgi:hypothetical protein